MASSVEDLEKQLSGYAIKEMNDGERKDAILLSLARGQVMPLTFEKSIVPADEIERYAIVEHLFQTPFKSNNGYTHAELNSFKVYDDAVRFFSDKLSKLPENNDDVGYISELMLVGQFKGKDLQYYENSDLDKSKGITLDYAFLMPAASYQLTSGLDPFRPVIIREQMYAVVDPNSKGIQFYDSSFNKRTVDASFWRIDKGQPEKQKEIENEAESLLPKKRTNTSNKIKL